MMLSNCDASVRRPTARTLIWNIWFWRRGLLADLSGGDLDVLLRQRGDRRRDAVSPRAASRDGSSHKRMEYLRSPKMMHVSDALNTLQRILHVNVEIIADELVDCSDCLRL